MFEKILLPLDGSELSEQAIASARGMAQAFNSQLHLLQVLSLRDQFALTRGMDYGAVSSGLSQSLMDEVTAAETAKAEEYLAGVAVRLKADGLDVVTAIPEGPAAEKIIEYAESQSIDLIVMSTHGRGGIQRLLVGSVTDRVIRSSTLPVLVVRPD